MIRFGLCCIFKDQPIKFKRTTAKYLSQFSQKIRHQHLSMLCLSNAESLMKALVYCRANDIGDFRINSQILPLKTHPEMGYEITQLPGADQIIKGFMACGQFSRQHRIRTTFHPDQFIVLSSPNPDVVKRSALELEYQGQVAQWVNADVINIHAGGAYGDKASALKRLAASIESLSDQVRERLTLENDDRSYTPKDLLRLCREMNTPLVYDVHHHRCLTDDLSIEQASVLAVKTWNREPVFHVSSPILGWHKPDIRKHHDYIDKPDFPKIWLSMDLTVEVEAKAKELAVKKLMNDLR